MRLEKVDSCFLKRREQLAKSAPCSLFLICGGKRVFRNRDVPYSFRQESNFYYLTGFDEPGALLAVFSDKDGKAESLLFVKEQDVKQALWEGACYGVERTQALFGVDQVFEVSQWEEVLKKKITPIQRVFYTLGEDEAEDRKWVMFLKKTWLRAQGRRRYFLLPVLDPRKPLGMLRVQKGKKEIQSLKKATALSAQVHAELLEWVRPEQSEEEIAIFLEHAFRKKGLPRLAYESIVASGEHALCLHYTENAGVLKKEDLLLVDAGGEYGFYAADITRTFPVGKTYTKAQAALYDLVLGAQKKAIASCQVGVRFEKVHQVAVRVLVEGLVRLGFFQEAVEEVIEKKRYNLFYPHSTSHWLGLDVHDLGPLLEEEESQSIVLKPNMVLTVEPGIYVPVDANVPEPYRGIGIRIEDDIWVREGGPEILTSGAPKERAEIEKIRSRAF